MLTETQAREASSQFLHYFLKQAKIDLQPQPAIYTLQDREPSSAIVCTAYESPFGRLTAIYHPNQTGERWARLCDVQCYIACHNPKSSALELLTDVKRELGLTRHLRSDPECMEACARTGIRPLGKEGIPLGIEMAVVVTSSCTEEDLAQAAGELGKFYRGIQDYFKNTTA